MGGGNSRLKENENDDYTYNYKIPSRELLLKEVPIYHRGPIKIKTSDDILTHKKQPGRDIAIIGMPMHDGAHRLTFRIVNRGEKSNMSFGILDTVWAHTASFRSTDGRIQNFTKGPMYRARTGELMTGDDQVEAETESASIGGKITMQIDLTSPNPAERTLIFYFNNKQQPYYFTGLPKFVEFGVELTDDKDEIRFIMFEHLEVAPFRIQPSSKRIEYYSPYAETQEGGTEKTPAVLPPQQAESQGAQAASSSSAAAASPSFSSPSSSSSAPAAASTTAAAAAAVPVAASASSASSSPEDSKPQPAVAETAEEPTADPSLSSSSSEVPQPDGFEPVEPEPVAETAPEAAPGGEGGEGGETAQPAAETEEGGENAPATEEPTGEEGGVQGEGEEGVQDDAMPPEPELAAPPTTDTQELV